jgi:hypothetical protein
MIVIEKIFGRAARLDLGNKLLFFIFLHSSTSLSKEGLDLDRQFSRQPHFGSDRVIAPGSNRKHLDKTLSWPARLNSKTQIVFRVTINSREPRSRP